MSIKLFKLPQGTPLLRFLNLIIEVLNCRVWLKRMSDGTVVCGPEHNESVVATMNEGLGVATISAYIIEWVPHCEDETFKPSIGRIIGSFPEAEEFYTCYARLADFSIRKGTSLLDKNRELVEKYFLFSRIEKVQGQMT